MTLSEENVADYAHTLVLQARGAGVTLDFTEGSLATLEELFRISDPLLTLPQMPEPQRNLVVFYAGCYLGETLARSLGGVWGFAPNWFESTVTFATATGGVQIRPFEKVLLRATEPESNDLADYARGLRSMLPDTLPVIPPDY